MYLGEINMSDNSIINRFLDLGLSHYESQVIVSIYSLGKAKATEISKHSKVPKAKIYGVLDSLCNKRLIRMHATKPLAYSSIEPKKFFEILEELEKNKFLSKKNDIENNKNNTIDDLKELYENSKSTQPTQELVEIIKLGEPSHLETKKTISNSKKKLCLLTESFEFLPIVEEELDAAITRGVDIKVVISSDKNIKKENLKEYSTIVSKLKSKKLKIKFCDEWFHIRYALNDPEEKSLCRCILVVKEYDVPKDMRNAIFSKNQSFVKGMKNHFDCFWQRSREK